MTRTAETRGAILPLHDIGNTVEAGSTDTEFIPAGAIHDLQQIRDDYSPEELQELADRIPIIETDNGMRFELVHPVTVARFSTDALLIDFLNEHARYYKYDFDASTLHEIPQYNGTCNIRVSGHRRGRAVAMKAYQEGVDIENVVISSTIMYNPTFWEARRKQFIENTFSSVKPSEDARAMKREYLYRWDQEPSDLVGRATEIYRIKQIAEFMGFSFKKVDDGLLYSTIPESIRQYESNGLSYSAIVMLARLRKAYANKQLPDGTNKHTLKEADEKMQDYFRSQILNRLRGARSSSVTTAIEAKLAEVTKEVPFIAEELFKMDIDSSRKASRAQIERQIVDAASLALMQGLASESPTDRKRIADAIIALNERLQELAASGLVQLPQTTIDDGTISLFEEG